MLTLADGKIKLTMLTAVPGDPANLKVSDLTGGKDLQDNILKSDYVLGATASDTISEAPLSSTGNGTTWGASNYQGSITPFRFLDVNGAPDPTNDFLFSAVKEKGTTIVLVEREGPDPSTPWKEGDEYSLYVCVTDTPQKPSERTGYIKRVVPLGVQRAYENRKLAASA